MSTYDGHGAIRDLSSEIDQLRADLATVTAEREEAKAARERLDQDWKRRHAAWLEQQAREVHAHAETRKAPGSHAADLHCLRVTQDALAKAEARVKELETYIGKMMLVPGETRG